MTSPARAAVGLAKEAILRDFPVLRKRGVAYLDSVDYTLTPMPVVDAMYDYYSGVELGPHSEDAYRELLSRCERKAARLFDLKEYRLIAVCKGNAMVDIVAAILCSKGVAGAVAISEALREVCVASLLSLTSRLGVPSIVVPAGERLPEASVACLADADRVDGSLIDSAEVSREVRERGGVVVVDCSVTAARTSLSLSRTEAHVVLVSGDGVLGPRSTSLVFCRRDMDPGRLGAWLKASEASLPELAGLATALDYLSVLGRDRVARHVSRMASRVAEVLGGPGLRLLGPGEAGVVSAAGDESLLASIHRALVERGVLVGFGSLGVPRLVARHGASYMLRISPYVYNWEEDVERLERALRSVKV